MPGTFNNFVIFGSVGLDEGLVERLQGRRVAKLIFSRLTVPYHIVVRLIYKKGGELLNNKETFFEQLYVEYSDQVYSYVFLMIGNATVSEDITQDTFVQVYKSLDNFQQKSSISTWIIAIARNRTIDYIRKQRKFTFFPIEKRVIKDENPTPAEIIEKGEVVVTLFKGIKQLKWEYQEVLILRKIKELSMEETSLITGWSVSKVKSTTTRALAALRKVMKKEDERV